MYSLHQSESFESQNSPSATTSLGATYHSKAFWLMRQGPNKSSAKEFEGKIEYLQQEKAARDRFDVENEKVN
ncbi:MAG: hypothetical protein KA293_02630 [Bacteroidia bacterium]|nr:hypothetical protein [Bacteroidota bacterium]MBP6639161.1 hypothetical protein [Bacteroidia bacterium]